MKTAPSPNHRVRLFAWLRASVLGLTLLALTASISHAGWTPLASPAPGGVGLMLLLPDGTVMAASRVTDPNEVPTSSGSRIWYRLTPDSTGSYVDGTWTTRASSISTRLWYSTAILLDGRVFVAGGEYGTGGSSAEIYNPVTDTWTAAASPGVFLSDSVSKILPDGRVLVAPASGGFTLIYDPVADAWVNGPPPQNPTNQNEVTWLRLPDGSILTVPTNTQTSQRYIPALNDWRTDDNVPVNLYSSVGSEVGGAFLLPNGDAFFLGGDNKTALYTPSGNLSNGQWRAGPDIPNVADSLSETPNFVPGGAPDCGAAMMVNGSILCAFSPQMYPNPADNTKNIFPSPTSFFVYDPVANSFAPIPGPLGTPVNNPAYQNLMLVLPSGEVLYSNFNPLLFTYRPDTSPTPLAAAKPAITSVSKNPGSSWHLEGIGLNGISEGASYGDDAQMDTNYPLVRFSRSGVVAYGRTLNRSSVGVQLGSTVTSTDFVTPVGIDFSVGSSWSLQVVTNGIASDPVEFGGQPVITSITPACGEPVGGLPVTIKGHQFYAGATVTFDGIAATDVVVVNPSTITARIPAHPLGSVNVSLSTSWGTASSTFLYTFPPIITGVTPGSAPIAGGTTVTIKGQHLTNVTTVKFGTTTATNLTVLDDSTLTVTAPAHAKGWVDVSITDGDCTNVSTSSFAYTLPTGAVDWTEHTTSGSRGWADIASSADGSKLIAADYGSATTIGRLWHSADGGDTWQLRGPLAHWLRVASSASGSVLLASTAMEDPYNTPGALLYVSTDSGTTWAPRNPGTSHQWHAVACSADGTKMAAIGQVDPYTTFSLWLSSDSGDTWIRQTNLPSDHYWRAVTISGDGSVVGVASNADGFDYGTIWTSTNFGGTWTERTSAGQHAWYSITSSYDGTRMAAVHRGTIADAGGKVFTSIDSGATWTLEPGSPVGSWNKIASGTSGLQLIGLNSSKSFPYGNTVTTSADGGASWDYQLDDATFAVADAPYFSSVAINSDGTRLAATEANAYIWTSEIVTPPTITFITPKQGPVTGNTTVTITGTGFRAPTTVTFDGLLATDVTVINSTTLTAVTPAHPAAPVNVSLTTKHGVATRANGYIYGVPLTVEQPVAQVLASNDTVTLDSAEWFTSTSKSITLRNTGTTAITGLALNLTSPSGEFTATPLDGTPLAPGATRTFDIIFTPITSGTRTASLSISNDLTDPFLLSLQGNGLPVLSEIAVYDVVVNGDLPRTENAPNNFGFVTVPGSGTNTFKIKNLGTTPLRNLAIDITGAQAGSFSFTGPSITTLQPNEVTTFTLTFTPSGQGDYSALASIASNDPNQNPFRIPLLGTGRTAHTSATLFASASPVGPSLGDGDTFHFPDTANGGSSQQTFTIRNDNPLPLTGLDFQVVGPDSANFDRSLVPNTLEVGASATFTMTFSPTALRSFNASLRIDSSRAIDPIYLNLTGTGIAPPPPSPALYSWGGNFLGQLGDGTTNSRTLPGTVDKSGVLAGKQITAIAGGQLHTLALSSQGKVYAWGANFNGQLGTGTTTSSNSAVVTDMTGALAGKTVAAISAANSQSFALTTEGRVYAWGYGGSGQLGTGAFSGSTTPIEIDMSGVLAGKTITQISAGANHAVVIASDGQAYCWGTNGSGQIGHGFSFFYQPYAAAVSTAGVLAGKTITHVAAGFDHTLAVSSDGQVFAWGGGVSGALGDGSNIDSNVPVAVDMTGALLGKTVTKVACGNGHSVALTSDGKVYAWGANGNGQLGDGTTTPHNSPVAVIMNGALAGKTVAKIAASNHQTIALTTDGFMFAWGGNANGALGDGTTDDRLAPVAVNTSGVLAGKVIGAISAGEFHTLAIEYAPPPPSPLETWRQLHFPGSTATTGPGADTATPQNDGISNLMKFALGMDPDVPGTLPITSAEVPGGGEIGPQLTLTYTPSAEAVAAGVIFQVEFSTSLAPGSWNSGPVNQGFIGAGGFPVTASVPKPESGEGFLRLSVTAPP